jgi:hypothetical protein
MKRDNCLKEERFECLNGLNDKRSVDNVFSNAICLLEIGGRTKDHWIVWFDREESVYKKEFNTKRSVICSG